VFEVRPSSNADEFARSVYGITQYFGAPLDEDRVDRFKQVLPFERMHAAFEDGEIVGGAGAFPFEFSVPGGVLTGRSARASSFASNPVASSRSALRTTAPSAG
jgi:hypothetical protein